MNLNSQEGIDKVIDIASDAISYTILTRAFESLNYILKFWKEMYIVPHIYDNTILEVLKNYKVKIWSKIMKLLLSYDLTFYYSNFKKEAIEKVVNEIKSKSHPNSLSK